MTLSVRWMRHMVLWLKRSLANGVDQLWQRKRYPMGICVEKNRGTPLSRKLFKNLSYGRKSLASFCSNQYSSARYDLQHTIRLRGVFFKDILTTATLEVRDGPILIWYQGSGFAAALVLSCLFPFCGALLIQVNMCSSFLQYLTFVMTTCVCIPAGIPILMRTKCYHTGRRILHAKQSIQRDHIL